MKAAIVMGILVAVDKTDSITHKNYYNQSMQLYIFYKNADK
jgi:hypothetical protein